MGEDAGKRKVKRPRPDSYRLNRCSPNTKCLLPSPGFPLPSGGGQSRPNVKDGRWLPLLSPPALAGGVEVATGPPPAEGPSVPPPWLDDDACPNLKGVGGNAAGPLRWRSPLRGGGGVRALAVDDRNGDEASANSSYSSVSWVEVVSPSSVASKTRVETSARTSVLTLRTEAEASAAWEWGDKSERASACECVRVRACVCASVRASVCMRVRV